jgi:hypothetical protein
MTFERMPGILTMRGRRGMTCPLSSARAEERGPQLRAPRGESNPPNLRIKSPLLYR